MPDSSLIVIENIYFDVAASDKASLLHQLALLSSTVTGLEPSVIENKLNEREVISSTGTGKGIAIPHGRFENLPRSHVFFIKLREAVDFASIDNKPVDLVFLMFAPIANGTEHLKTLSRISRMMRDDTTCTNLREAETVEEAYEIIKRHS